MSDLKQITAKILSEDKKVISYRPSWKNMTGSITSAILLQQIRFHWVNKGGKPFYKFFSPPQTEHDKYRIGDSWTEELGFTLDELRGAMKKIAKRLAKDDMEDLKSALDGHFVGYFRDQNHVTWHYFNEDYFLEQVIKLYSEKGDSVPDGKSPGGKIQSSPQMGNPQVGKSNLAKWEIPTSILSETPTETPINTIKEQPPINRQDEQSTIQPIEEITEGEHSPLDPIGLTIALFLKHAHKSAPDNPFDRQEWEMETERIYSRCGNDPALTAEMVVWAIGILTQARTKSGQRYTIASPTSLYKTIDNELSKRQREKEQGEVRENPPVVITYGNYKDYTIVEAY